MVAHAAASIIWLSDIADNMGRLEENVLYRF